MRVVIVMPVLGRGGETRRQWCTAAVYRTTMQMVRNNQHHAINSHQLGRWRNKMLPTL